MEINNRERKINVRRDGELLGFLKYTVYPEADLIYLDYIEIYEQYRQQGLAMLLYREFSKIYNSQYQGWRIARTFINPVAEYTFSKAVAEGLFPEEMLTGKDVSRYYSPEEEQKWYNELEPKLKDLRKSKGKNV